MYAQRGVVESCVARTNAVASGGRLPEVATGEVANVALSEPVASWDFTTQQPLVKCAVTLYHQGKIENAQIVYHVNGDEIMRREVTRSEQPESLTLLTE